MELRVYPDGRVQVRAPLRTALRHIQAFVDERQEWLRTQLAIAAQTPVPSPPRYRDGDEHLFLGQRLPLRLEAGSRGRVWLSAQGWHVRAPDLSEDSVSRRMDDWRRRQARVLFDELVDRHYPWFEQRGHVRPEVRVRQMKSRWGSLSSRGGMSLNLELLKVPVNLIEYVVVHELCHLEHANHGPGFRALMTERMPDWALRRQTLNRAPLI